MDMDQHFILMDLYMKDNLKKSIHMAKERQRILMEALIKDDIKKENG